MGGHAGHCLDLPLVTNTRIYEYTSVGSNCLFGWDSVRYNVAAGMRNPLTWLRPRVLSPAIFSGPEPFTAIRTAGLAPPGTPGWRLCPPCAISQEAPTPEHILLLLRLDVDVLSVPWIPPERRLRCPSAFCNGFISPVGKGLPCSVRASGPTRQSLLLLTPELL